MDLEDIKDLAFVGKALRKQNDQKKGKSPARKSKSIKTEPTSVKKKSKSPAKKKSSEKPVKSPAKKKSAEKQVKSPAKKAEAPVKKVKNPPAEEILVKALKKVSDKGKGKGKQLVVYKGNKGFFSKARDWQMQMIEELARKGQAAKTVLKFIAPAVGLKVVEYIIHNPKHVKDLQVAALNYLRSNIASVIAPAPPPPAPPRDLDKEHFEAVKNWAKDELSTFAIMYGKALYHGIQAAFAVGTLSVAWIPRHEI